MSAFAVSGQITITIGTSQITLTTADINQTPKVFSLPEGESINISLADLNTYLNQQFQIPTITFPGVSETNLIITKFYINSLGIFDIAVNFVFGGGQGWTIFPGFTLNQVGFEVNYSKVPNITSITPITGAVASAVTLAGYDLAAATAVNFGTTPGTGLTANTANGITVTVPAGLAAGAQNVTLVNPDGTSNSVVFTVTA